MVYCGNGRKRSAWTYLLIAVAVPPFAIYGVAQETVESLRRSYSKRKADRRHTWLPRRVLSDLDLPERSKKKALVTGENRQTSLFLSKLPLELRQAVYSSYYEGAVLTVCELFWDGYRYAAFTGGINDGLRRADGTPRWDNWRDRVSKGFLELPLTCRQIYLESINYVYSTPTFRFDIFSDAVALPRMFLPQRLQALRSINIDLTREHFSPLGPVDIQGHKELTRRRELWTQLCETLATLPHLERLHVKLKLVRMPSLQINVLQTKDWALILEPLMRVEGKQVREFEVQVDYIPDGGPALMERAPFRLVLNEELGS